MKRVAIAGVGTEIAAARPSSAYSTTTVIWAYFSNRADSRRGRYALRAIAGPIFHDIGTTLPT